MSLQTSDNTGKRRYIIHEGKGIAIDKVFYTDCTGCKRNIDHFQLITDCSCKKGKEKINHNMLG